MEAKGEDDDEDGEEGEEESKKDEKKKEEDSVKITSEELLKLYEYDYETLSVLVNMTLSSTRKMKVNKHGKQYNNRIEEHLMGKKKSTSRIITWYTCYHIPKIISMCFDNMLQWTSNIRL